MYGVGQCGHSALPTRLKRGRDVAHAPPRVRAGHSLAEEQLPLQERNLVSPVYPCPLYLCRPAWGHLLAQRLTRRWIDSVSCRSDPWGFAPPEQLDRVPYALPCGFQGGPLAAPRTCEFDPPELGLRPFHSHPVHAGPRTVLDLLLHPLSRACHRFSPHSRGCRRTPCHHPERHRNAMAEDGRWAWLRCLVWTVACAFSMSRFGLESRPTY